MPAVSLGLRKETVENIYAAMKARHIAMKEKATFGRTGHQWHDVEADEVDLGKALLQHLTKKTKKKKPDKCLEWEQWGGRGRLDYLPLFRLMPKNTPARAPGPGPIKKSNGYATEGSCLKKVILHTDGSRAYKTPFTNIIHCHVVCQKKKAEKGKVVWLNPSCTKVYDLKMSDGAHLKVKSGGQVIDRFWHELRRHLCHVARLPGNKAMTRKVRSAQCFSGTRMRTFGQQLGTCCESYMSTPRYGSPVQQRPPLFTCNCLVRLLHSPRLCSSALFCPKGEQ